MYALVLFTVGSALCGLASSTGELIAFRVLQGLGGGLLAPTGMTILVKATGQENLPKVMAAIGVPMVLAPILGPTLGGFLLQSVGWHAIFLVNVPVGIATGIVALRLLPRDRAGARGSWGVGLAGAGSGRRGHRRHHLRALPERLGRELHIDLGRRPHPARLSVHRRIHRTVAARWRTPCST